MIDEGYGSNCVTAGCTWEILQTALKARATNHVWNPIDA